jgi:3-polyprenyl-4-hydroxybenzoate decarboxylase
MRRIIIGMTGSTGAIFGVRMLEALKGARSRP